MTSRNHPIAVRVFGAVLTFCLAGSIARSEVPVPAAFDPANPPTTMHLNWSRPVDGVRIRLACDHPVIRAGQPVELTFKLENCGTQMRSVLLPVIQPLIVPVNQPVPRNSTFRATGDLVITAEPLDTDANGGPATRQTQTRSGEIGPLPLMPGQQIWITINAGSTLRLAPVQFVGGMGGGKGPMLHMKETALFPGLNHPGRYRLTASFSATGVTQNGFNQQVQLNDDPSNTWAGRIDSPPIDVEVVGNAAAKD